MGRATPQAALRLRKGLRSFASGASTQLLEYMHSLAWEAAGVLTDCWQTTLETPRAMVGAMVTVPLPETAGATDDDAARLRLALLVEDRIEVQLHAWHGRLWVRVSAQIYNDRSDMAQLAEAVLRRLRSE